MGQVSMRVLYDLHSSPCFFRLFLSPNFFVMISPQIELMHLAYFAMSQRTSDAHRSSKTSAAGMGTGAPKHDGGRLGLRGFLRRNIFQVRPAQQNKVLEGKRDSVRMNEKGYMLLNCLINHDPFYFDLFLFLFLF